MWYFICGKEMTFIWVNVYCCENFACCGFFPFFRAELRWTGDEACCASVRQDYNVYAWWQKPGFVVLWKLGNVDLSTCSFLTGWWMCGQEVCSFRCSHREQPVGLAEKPDDVEESKEWESISNSELIMCSHWNVALQQTDLQGSVHSRSKCLNCFFFFVCFASSVNINL